MALKLFLCLTVIALTASIASSKFDVSQLADLHSIPRSSSSPGWKDVPHDACVISGGSVTFRCFNVLPYTRLLWVFNGKTVVITSLSKFILSDSNTTLTYGPVETGDHGAVIGCEVETQYGLLPSPVGKITIKSLPLYKPQTHQVAHAGEPFDFDFGYASLVPPSSFSWTKNSLPFMGDGSRVILSHRGITFTKVGQVDAGEYVVTATNEAGSRSFSAILQVVFFKSLHSRNSTLSEKISTRLAISLALERIHSSHSDSQVTLPSRPLSKIAVRFIKIFKKFKKALPFSKQNGRARIRTEELLLATLKLLEGSNVTLSDEDIDMVEQDARCLSKPFPTCTIRDLQYRTADGSCNNFFFPLKGASGTPFARILPANYEDGISAPVGQQQLVNGKSFEGPWPSARYVSWRVIRSLQRQNSDAITHMFMQWGQFVDHDLDIAPVFGDACGCSLSLTCIPIEVNPNDAVFGRGSSNNASCLVFTRSVPACASSTRRRTARDQVNDLTSYIDASNVYGSTQEVADGLRLFKAGLLKQGGRLETLKGNLPVEEASPDFSALPFFVGGDVRVNEQLGLTIMHTVWLREHNRIARELMTINPCWDDERLYQETRKIVGAMQQVISFNEFLPTLFGPSIKTYIPHYRGYNPFVDASIPNSFAAAAYRFGHSLVRNQFDRLDRNFRRLSIGPLPLQRAFFNPISYFESLGTDPILRGLTIVRSNPLDEFLNAVLTSQLFVEKGRDLGMDLTSLNIQRSRDHGLPTYRQWEKFCKRLFPTHKANFKRAETEQILREVYGSAGFERGIDLWVGGLAEEHLPGAQLGPTFACIIGIAFSRARDGDRFWYQIPYVFKSSQRRELMKTTLAKVVCTNGDDIPTIQKSVFEAGRPRVPCSSIPSLDLLRWKDKSCYKRKRH